MSNKHKPGDWITVGNIDAVICTSYPDNPDRLEIVYLDERDRAINDNILFSNDKWDFEIQGASGGYADRYDRLSEFVSVLRRGRYRM